MNRDETERMLEFVKARYDTMVVTEDTIAAWTMDLGDLDYPAVMFAANAHIRGNAFPPKPADIRRVVGALFATTIPDWEQGWAEMDAVRKQHGTYVSERFGGPGLAWSSDMLARAIKHVGGYRALCELDYDDEPTVRAQFRDYYTKLRDQAIERVVLGDVAQLPSRTDNDILPAWVDERSIVPD